MYQLYSWRLLVIPHGRHCGSGTIARCMLPNHQLYSWRQLHVVIPHGRHCGLHVQLGACCLCICTNCCSNKSHEARLIQLLYNLYWPLFNYIRMSDFLLQVCQQGLLASFPGLHAQLLPLAVRKAGEGLDGFIMCCVQRLTSFSVCSHLGCSLPFTLLSMNSVRSFCAVCPVSPIATGLIVASYSM